MTATKCYIASMFLIIVFVIVVQAAEYADYEDGLSKSVPESIRELYNMLVQRDEIDDERIGVPSFQHLMVRKSQRSPSLRLRFGRRSGPLLSQDLPSASFDEDYMNRKYSRSPSLRLRFGRRNDPLLSMGSLSGTERDVGSVAISGN